MSAELSELFMMPIGPSFSVDWPELNDRFDWIRAMVGAQQDPFWHAEGDVWIHTRMVCEELTSLPAWRKLDATDRLVTWLGALLHDVAKPYSSKEVDGRVRSRHHATRGAVHARRILWEAGADVGLREQVCGLVRHHQLPIHAADGERSAQRMSAASLRCSLSLLAIVAEADIRGRVCEDTQEQLQAIELFVEYARDLACYESAREFPSDHSRLLYFSEARPADVLAFDDTEFTVTLMCGLPGAGKTRWLTSNLAVPRVSLDDIRAELRINPRDNQGAVRREATERARAHLRAKQDFAWDATNLSRDRRRKLVQLFRQYGARVEIVVVEADLDRLWHQNRTREQVVPQRVIESMLLRWEMPDATEAHRVVLA